MGLTEDDCTPLTGTVVCTHTAPSLKLWTYTLDSAEDAAGNDGSAGESDTLTVVADAGLTTTAEHYAATNPVAWYEYEEGCGTTLVDETGNAHERGLCGLGQLGLYRHMGERRGAVCKLGTTPTSRRLMLTPS